VGFQVHQGVFRNSLVTAGSNNNNIIMPAWALVPSKVPYAVCYSGFLLTMAKVGSL
jgi:hypothetical protein